MAVGGTAFDYQERTGIEMDKIQICDAANKDTEHITHQLIQYNDRQLAFEQEPPFLHINRCIRHGGEVVGGILSQIYWNMLHIDILWVQEAHRHNGYATALLTDVENTAKTMQCTIAHLDTYDFQAKGLYEKMGYTVFGALEDCPQGHTHYYMAKKLV